MALISVNASLDAVEIATVLAALHFWRDREDRPEELEYLACDGGQFSALEKDQISDLIVRLSGGNV